MKEVIGFTVLFFVVLAIFIGSAYWIVAGVLWALAWGSAFFETSELRVWIGFNIYAAMIVIPIRLFTND